MNNHEFLSPIETILEDAKAGKMFILMDDEDRENEGDLVIPAQMADATAINFMAKYGRGLICLAMGKARIQTLGLPPMSHRNRSRHQTAFTVSIEAREGVTTGISAADRARTIEVAIDDEAGRDDIATPGHVFPLEAREGGVLVRAGHTEAAVDISRMAGLNPSGVICEIMNDDGTMARLPDLVEFAREHDLHIATIADLIAYRRQHDSLVKRVVQTTFNSRYGGEFDMMIYANTIEYAEHVALVKGPISGDEPVNVRVHQLDVLSDVLADADHPHHKQKSMEIIAKEGGILLLMREDSRDALSRKIMKREASAKEESPSVNGEDIIRDYGVGAQILLDLGVRKMRLLSSSHKALIGLEGYGLEVVEQRELA